MNKEEELFQKRILELAHVAYHRNIVSFSDFMNLNELNIFHNTTKDIPFVTWNVFGGYEFAERQMAAFLPDALSYDYTYPIRCIHIRKAQKKFAQELTHRDYLGAVLHLGIERSKIGDIVVDGDDAYLFCRDTMAEFIRSELTKIRHTAVICTCTELQELTIEPKLQEITGTVSSVRLDSTMALAFRTSRSKLTGLIESGKVFVNGKCITSNAYHLKDQDIISVRGMGRYQFQGEMGQTKKGRVSIRLGKYI